MSRKIRNVRGSSVCECYRLRRYEKEWEKLNRRACNMCGVKGKMDHGHVNIGNSTSMFITPLCSRCNRSKRSDWVKPKNSGNWYQLYCSCLMSKENQSYGRAPMQSSYIML